LKEYTLEKKNPFINFRNDRSSYIFKQKGMLITEGYPDENNFGRDIVMLHPEDI
jgi:hypothetical protein